MPTTKKELFLLDAYALIYRAHFAFINRPLINSKGVNTSAVTGFVRSLWDVLKKHNPSHIAVAFDRSEPTFRHEMMSEYKANREEQPEDIGVAIPYIKRILEAMCIPQVSSSGYEADDVIGTLAKQAEQEGFVVYMMTPDKDYAQLVSDNIFLYKPSRMGNGVDVLSKADILKKWDIARPEQVADVLGMWGDTSDNIPGIPGIGKKTASTLLKKYDSVENIVANVADFKGKRKENLELYGEQGILSKKLATIITDVPVTFNADDYEVCDFKTDELADIFQELEFRRLAEEILGGRDAAVAAQEERRRSRANDGQGSLFPEEAVAAEPARHSVADQNINNTDHTYHLADTVEQQEALVELLATQSAFAFDTETSGVDANEAELVGMSFATRAGEGWYVPVPSDRAEADAIVARFKGVLESEEIQKIGQNLKFDMLIMKWYGVEVQGPLFDTMLAHYLYEPELRHNMNYLSETYLGYQPVSIESLIGKKGKKQKTMRDIPVEEVAPYAAEDADITLRLKEHFAPILKEENLTGLYEELELPLIPVLTDMEYEGVNVDVDFLNNYATELRELILQREQMIYEAAGTQFNIASPKQVGEVLFDRLKIPYRWRKTKSGHYSTNEEKLTEVAEKHPVAAKILEHRSLMKLLGTYVTALPKLINPKSGRIHTSFNQAVTATGRLSSNNPNLQNIPIRTPEGARIRQAFVPRNEDYILLAADYSQIELRLIAELSGDEGMVSAFQQGLDIHTATAARVFDVPLDEVTKEQRRRAKTLNFAIIYGAGATNIAGQLGISRHEAGAIIKQYYDKYDGLKAYMDEQVRIAQENQVVTTLKGRRRYLRDINSRSSVQRSLAERNAVNTPIQGTAADMIKIAMIDIHREFKKRGFKSKMVLQVHDELVFDAHRDEVETITPIIIDLMKNAMPDLKVPIVVEVGTGEHWLEAH